MFAVPFEEIATIVARPPWRHGSSPAGRGGGCAAAPLNANRIGSAAGGHRRLLDRTTGRRLRGLARGSRPGYSWSAPTWGRRPARRLKSAARRCGRRGRCRLGTWRGKHGPRWSMGPSASSWRRRDDW